METPFIPTPELSATAARWWADRWEQPASREKFYDALLTRISEPLGFADLDAKMHDLGRPTDERNQR
jgi:hypothetical protein